MAPGASPLAASGSGALPKAFAAVCAGTTLGPGLGGPTAPKRRSHRLWSGSTTCVPCVHLGGTVGTTRPRAKRAAGRPVLAPSRGPAPSSRRGSPPARQGPPACFPSGLHVVLRGHSARCGRSTRRGGGASARLTRAPAAQRAPSAGAGTASPSAWGTVADSGGRWRLGWDGPFVTFQSPCLHVLSSPLF